MKSFKSLHKNWGILHSVFYMYQWSKLTIYGYYKIDKWTGVQLFYIDSYVIPTDV